MEERCKVTQALCTVLRSASEVNGVVVGADGTETKPQGQVTVFRLTPGSRVLPHVGVTNKRLVLQFPLRGFEGVRIRVGDTWRSYEEGHAMVFDDSFEHEVLLRIVHSYIRIYISYCSAEHDTRLRLTEPVILAVTYSSFSSHDGLGRACGHQ